MGCRQDMIIGMTWYQDGFFAYLDWLFLKRSSLCVGSTHMTWWYTCHFLTRSHDEMMKRKDV